MKNKTQLEWQIAYAWIPQDAKECPSDAIRIITVHAATKTEALKKTRTVANADGSQPLCDLETRIISVIGDRKALAEVLKRERA